MGCWVLSSTMDLGPAASSLDAFKRGQRPLMTTEITKNTEGIPAKQAF